MSADLKPGMCLTLDPTKQPQIDGALPVVNCATPHTSEVVGVITLPKGKYPGASGFVRAVNDKCGRLAEKYVDEAQVTSEMYLGYLAPTGVQWTLGNRVVACMAVDPSGKRKKSIKR
jgi:hypothetical protein